MIYMAANFTVVAFYTYDTPYEDEVRGLEKTCKEHDIPIYTKGYQSKGTWVENCAIKSTFLMHVMLTHPGKRFVYLDADARIRRYPSIFDTLSCDLAYHYRNHKELLSGTIYFEKNKTVLDVFTGWQQEQLRNPTTWDQRTLQSVITRWTRPLDVVTLPLAYTQIFDAKERSEEPVIEHMQASRAYKKLIELPELVSAIPYEMDRIRLRRGADGCIFISRNAPAVEKKLDIMFQRIDVRKWRPRVLSDLRIEDFRDAFKGRPTYIVGKGPSLDKLTRNDFKDRSAPVMALNEAIHVVEALKLPNPVFCVQQDARLKARCQPKDAPIFVSCKAANYYAGYGKAFIFENRRLRLSKDALSVSAALRLSGFLGTTEYILLCFDACVTGSTDYADAIGYKSTWGGPPSRFLAHRKRILKHTDGLKVTWLIPGAPSGSSAGRPRQ